MENEENIVTSPNASKTVSYYEDIFCDAVSTIVQGYLQGVSFDRTVLCKIIDDTQRKQGVYIVTENNSTKFEAVSSDTTYRKNQNVYVQIPGGDWNQQKLIIGKKVDTTVEPYTYKKPFSNLIDITGNLISSDKVEAGLTANGNIQEIVLWRYNSNKEDDIPKDEGDYFGGYTRLGIQAGFKTKLNPFYLKGENIPRSIVKGEFGLKLVVYGLRERTNEEETDADLRTQQTLYLNQEDMNGNIYDFNTFFSQEKVFDISGIHTIIGMELIFYQNPDTFMDNKGNLISTDSGGFLNTPIKANLFVDDVYISLGYNAEDFNKETIQIFSLDSSTYSSDLIDNNKYLQLRWVHRQADNTFKSIAERDNIDYEIKWYRYKFGDMSNTDADGGIYWNLLSTETRKTIDDQVEYSINIIDPDWHTYNESNQNNQKLPSFFSSWLIPNMNWNQEQIKAVLIYNDEVYTSNILTFTNQKKVVDTSILEATQAFTIACNDGTNGNYRFYGQTNMIMDLSQSRKLRKIIPYFLSNSQNKDSIPEELKVADSIEWIVPTRNTMIVLEESTKSGGTIDDDGYIHIVRQGETAGSIEGVNALEYRVRAYYSQNDSNNTIQCKVIKGDIIYMANITLTFGQSGTTGTDATLVLDFNENITAVTLGDTKSLVTVTARLYDFENNEVDITGKEIVWSWKTKNSDLNKKDEEPQFNDLLTIDEEMTVGNICIIRPVADVAIGPNYHILQATVKNWGQYDLTAYLPIPVRSDSKYSYISGTTQVTYNSAGELIDYFKNPYVLYDREGNHILDQSENPNGETLELDWSSGDAADTYGLYYYVNNGIPEEKQYSPQVYKGKRNELILDEKGEPIVDEEGNKVIKSTIEYSLQPLKIYIDDTCNYICVTAKERIETLKEGSETDYEITGYNILWSQPILIFKDIYTNTTVNNWDGSFKMDKTNNAILSAAVIAGKKDAKDNSFSGIVLGDCGVTQEEANNDGSIISTSIIDNQIGLYGYKEGSQTFGFKEDGTAFIGGSTGGRLNFDGKESTIQSSSYLTDNTGLKLDFDNGLAEFSWKEVDGEQKGILIDGGASDYPLQIGKGFKVGWSGEVVLGSSLSSVGGVVEGDLRVTGRIISEKSGTEGTNSDIQWAIGADGSSSFNNIIITGGQIANCDVDYNSATGHGTIKSENFNSTLNKTGWCVTSEGEVYLNGRLFPSLDNIEVGQVLTTTDDGYAWTNAPSKKTINLTLNGTVPVLDTNNVQIGSVDLSKLTVEPVEIDTTLSDEEYNITLNITSV